MAREVVRGVESPLRNLDGYYRASRASAEVVANDKPDTVVAGREFKLIAIIDSHSLNFCDVLGRELAIDSLHKSGSFFAPLCTCDADNVEVDVAARVIDGDCVGRDFQPKLGQFFGASIHK